jgi:lysozyme family protein
MRYVTASIDELKELADHYDSLGFYTEADQIDSLCVRLAQQKKTRRRLTPFGKAMLYGLPSMMAGNSLLHSNQPPATVQKPKPQVQKPISAPEFHQQLKQKIGQGEAADKGNFQHFKQFTLPEEGGFVHRKKSDDPGGATNMGVTQNTYNIWRDSIHQPRQSVQVMSGDEAKKIMQQMYWNPIRGSELPERTAIALADMGYLEGPGDAVRALQKIIGITPDGNLGPTTLKRVWEFASSTEKDEALAVKLTQMREDGLRTRPHAKANPGWFNRTKRMKEFVKNDEMFADAGNDATNDVS